MLFYKTINNAYTIKAIIMKVIKRDYSKNHYRVVQRFAWYPKIIFNSYTNDSIWIFWVNYYELQLDSYWGKGWMHMEYSLRANEWDFKWSDKYIQRWKDSSTAHEKEEIKTKYPPNYKHSDTCLYHYKK